MIRAYGRFLDGLTWLAMTALGIVVGAIVVITLAGVWWRYVLLAPLSWTEQVSRILFVWVTFVGAAVLYRQKLHIAIDMFTLMLPAGLQRLAFWAVELIVFGFVLILLIYGWQLSMNTWTATFGALDITPASFYLAAPVSCAMMVLYFVEKLVDPTKREPTSSAGVV